MDLIYHKLKAMTARPPYRWIACDATGNNSIIYTGKTMSYLVITLDGEILASP